MEGVILDFSRGGGKQRLKGYVKTRIVSHGKWEIDDVKGKSICLIELTIPSQGITLNFPTTHSYCEDYLNKMLQCEWLNDRFEFATPVISKHRPKELRSKIERIQTILAKWSKRQNE